MTNGASTGLLRTTLMANVVFSELSGVAMLLFGGSLAAALVPGLGSAGPWLVRGLGAGLVVFALLVWRVARSAAPSVGHVHLIIVADILWVAASVDALAFASHTFTGAGVAVVATVAAIVAVIVIFEHLGLVRAVTARGHAAA
ncbi:hypothetical protein FHP25_02170 [Vineibacter terrae]|uniref:DUF2568 domain-containing protein n=1 Tax=Vineibacter terrae TaxID=2586908 RepID=A0A5C8PUX6_9HYPH|nr:hypothetical protein [Vineibacter terrae]TXL81894.1 hypothetical protein FHP25_02170 [Vineibacter terrae]